MSYQAPVASTRNGERSPGYLGGGAGSSEEATSPNPTQVRSHESIWKRSKKILGVGRFEFLRKNYADNTSDKETPGGSKGGKTGDAGKPAVSKRREQVRRAQKTHRQRTEHYIKALEQEVLRLQKVEEESLALKEQKKRENDYIASLEQQVVRLQTEETATFMVANAELTQGADVGNYLAKVTMSKKDRDGRSTMHAEIPQHFLLAPPTLQFTGIDQFSTELSQSQFFSYWDQLTRVNPLANHQSAIDFVLYLEFGCMDHVHPVGAGQSNISGHTLTASASLLEQAPQTAIGLTSWNASCTALDKLFFLSSDFELSNELTPIQAWNELWKYPDASLIQALELETLKQELQKITVCYGFGGVLDTSIFRNVLETMFVRIKTGRNGGVPAY